MRTVLVAGASGLVGEAALRQFTAAGGWRVIGLSRRPPSTSSGAELMALDLMDTDACRAALGSMADATHVVYAALQEGPGLIPGWTDDSLIERNAAMLRNLFEPLSAVAGNLQHVTLLHGTKAYGLHHPSVGLRGLRNPLRERQPRVEHPNFYFLQEDYLLEKQRSAAWDLTVFRPTVIYGGAWGANMNPLPAIAAYGALLHDMGEPLHFPGTGGAVVREAVDADLVASAIAWAAESPTARGETFNLTNGDVFTWDGVWPAIANALGMEPGERRPFSFEHDLLQHAERWRRLVEQHALNAPSDLLDFVGANSLVYTDRMMAGSARPGPPVLNSTIKARQAGFHDCMDTEDMFRAWIGQLQADGVIPARSSTTPS